MFSLYGILFVTIIVYLWLKRERKQPRRNQVPGPWGLPFVGYLPFLTKLPHLKLNQLAEQFGPVFGFRCGSINIVILNDYETTVEAFKNNDLNGRPVDVLHLSPSLTHFGDTNGSEWTVHRKFVDKNLKSYLKGENGTSFEKVLQEETSQIYSRIGQCKGSRSIDIRFVLGEATSNVAWNFNWGKGFQFVKPLTIGVVQQYQYTLLSQSTINSPTMLFPGIANIIRKFMPSLVTMDATASKLEKIINLEIEAREAQLDLDDPKDYIDHYLIHKQKSKDQNFTNASLNGNIQIIAIGGSDATRGSLEWMWLLLAHYQDAQQKMYEEIIKVFGYERTPTWDLKDQLPYTMATIYESERFVTTVPLSTVRRALADMTLKGYFIPKDTLLMSNTWAINNDPEYWKDPGVFRPERYLTKSGTFDHTKRFVTFSIGKRNCPGAGMAQRSLFSFTASVIQKFKLLPPEGGLSLDEIQNLVVIANQPRLRFVQR